MRWATLAKYSWSVRSVDAASPLAGTTLPVGRSRAAVIPVGATDTGHSSVVHVPALGLVVSGDVVYNQTHMWLMASTPETRASWRRALDAVAELQAGTIIAGHRNYAGYQDKTRREIAVVLLEPRNQAG